MIILDFGSGETCRNDKSIVKKMIDELVKVKKDKSNIVIKWQLFTKAEHEGKELLSLMPDVFDFAYKYAKEKEIMTTSSIFDQESNIVLSKYPIPFVKIANNYELYLKILPFLNRGVPVYSSVSNMYLLNNHLKWFVNEQDIKLACISKYPATIADYESEYPEYILNRFVSDHTKGLELYNKYRPMIWEKHYKLDDSIGADSGDHAITPQELKEIL